MEAADYEVLSVREQLFHDRVRECIVSAGPGREGAGPGWEGRGQRWRREVLLPGHGAPPTPARAGATVANSRVGSAGSLSRRKQSRLVSVRRLLAPPPAPFYSTPVGGPGGGSSCVENLIWSSGKGWTSGCACSP